MDEALSSWVRAATGATGVETQLVVGGGSRQTYFIDLDIAGRPLERVVLRHDTGASALSETLFSLRREATFYNALNGSAVPIPTLIAASVDGRSLLLECLDGTPDLSTLTDTDQRAAFESFMSALVALHSVDVRALNLAAEQLPLDSEDHARLDLSEWARAYEASRLRDPLVTFALAWLDRHAPGNVPKTSLVHGDCGPGNFLVADGRVTGIIDWEMAHLGDPMDDLAWIEARAAGQNVYGFSSRALVREEYERAGGAVDSGRLDYYRVFVATRCVIVPLLAADRVGSLGRSAYHKAASVWLSRLGRLLADQLGVVLDPLPVRAGQDVADLVLYEESIASVRSALLPHAQDRQDRLRAKEVLRFLRYLEARERFGSAFAADEASDRASYLNDLACTDAHSIELAAGEAGSRGDGGMLHYLVRRVLRRALLWGAKDVDSLPDRPEANPDQEKR